MKNTDKAKNIDKRYHNTKLLLRNYKDFKKHCDGCGKSLSDIDDQWDGDQEAFENYLKSARRTKERTAIFVKLIDTFLKSYKDDAVNRSDQNKLNRYKIIDLMYISSDKTMESLAIELNCDKATVSRWHNRAINELAVLFFGIEGLRLEA